MIERCEQLVATCTLGQRDRNYLLSATIRTDLSELDIGTAERASLQLDGKQVVYFIECDQLNAIKIGTTKWIRLRLHDLQVGCPAALYVRGAVLGGPREEALIHRLFDDLSIRGEWFTAAPRLRQFIADMPIGFDLRALNQSVIDQRQAETRASLDAWLASVRENRAARAESQVTP